MQSLLSQLGFAQEEGKRIKHQCQLMECAAAHARLQRRFPTHVTAPASTGGSGSGSRVHVGGESMRESVGGSIDFCESEIPLCASAANNFSYTVVEGPGPPPFHVNAGSADGLCGTNPFSDLDVKKSTYSKYGVESALSSQCDADRMRQELHREKNGRARDKHALSLSLEEAVARASFAESLAEDRR